MSLSVLILTHNEEANIRRCLRSVSWSDDVVVVDSGSTDATVDIAQAMGARVLHRKFDDFARQRNWGVENAGFRHDWVLHLDADEVVPREMHEELLDLAQSGRFSAYRLSLKLMFQEKWIRRASMFPAYQVRFGRRDRLRFRMEGHGQRETLAPEEVGTMQTSLLHYSFAKGIADWFEKHNRYSTAEALEGLRRRARDPQSIWDVFSFDRNVRWRALKNLSTHMPCRPLLRFIYMAFIRRGILDGVAGLHYCMLVVIYEYMIVLKEKELRQKQEREQRENTPAALASSPMETPANRNRELALTGSEAK